MDELMKMVQVTIAHAKNVCSTMQSAISLAKEMTEKAVAKIKVADDKETLNTKASEFLAEREVKIEKVENAVKLDEESKIRLAEVKKLITRLETAQSDFKTEKRKSLSDISAKNVKATNSLSEANREWKLLNEAKAQYETDKKNMREDILKELKNLK